MKEEKFAWLKLYDNLQDEIEVYKGDDVIAEMDAAEIGLIGGKEYKIIEVNSLDSITVINEKGKKEIVPIEYFR